jgi:hypothetical protein
MIVSAVERSGDVKLSANKNVSATWVPQQSCHDRCPLKRNGCYAETGNAGIHTHRKNKQMAKRKMGLARTRLYLAKQEARLIHKLTGTRKLRTHVVGDCATEETASIVGTAMVEHEKKAGKAAWSYTHSWPDIALKAWKGAKVLASCETADQAREATKLGYATVVITPIHKTHRVYEYQGLKIVPCPAQFKRADGTRHATCEECNLCQSPAMLLSRGLSVGFQPDGLSGKRILKVINNGGQRC